MAEGDRVIGVKGCQGVALDPERQTTSLTCSFQKLTKSKSVETLLFLGKLNDTSQASDNPLNQRRHGRKRSV